MCAIAYWLALALTAETPRVIFAGLETYPERLPVVYRSVLRLKISAVLIFDQIHGYWRLVGLCGETRNLENNKFSFYFVSIRKRTARSRIKLFILINPFDSNYLLYPFRNVDSQIRLGLKSYKIEELVHFFIDRDLHFHEGRSKNERDAAVD